MDNLLEIRLRAMNLELNHDRVYKVSLGRDLFNQWYVIITFGRYNTGGTSKTKYFEAKEEAYGFIDSQLKRRLTSPKRIGCPYQMVSLEGSDEVLQTINREVIERFSWFGNAKER